MKRIIFYIAIAAAGLCMPTANAQTVKDSMASATIASQYAETQKKNTIAYLEAQKADIAEQEKYRLKKAIEDINTKLELNLITKEQALTFKEEEAKKAALNIDNKSAIIDNQIELVKRNESYETKLNEGYTVELGFGNSYDDKGSFLLGVHYNAKNSKIKYDKRTKSDVVFASGFNNTVGEGKTIGDDYRFGDSQFVEIGIALRTRMFKNSNKIRLVYGLSYQFNILSPKNNRIFINTNEVTQLEEFPYKLKRNQLRMDNLVLPFHVEFGPSVKKEYKDYFRYDNNNKLNVGLGGFIGINTGATQRLRYKEGGDRITSNLRTDYNVNSFIYGVSGYIGIGSMSLYTKYEFNPVFKNSPTKEHNISFALRVDL